MPSFSSHIPPFSPMGERVRPPAIARLMAMALNQPGLFSLAAGFTDNRTLPEARILAAVAALGRRSGEPEYLQYGPNIGRPRLRQLLGERLQHWEPSLDADKIAERLFITNGSQQALYLAMQVLCQPGDIVLVDRPSYFVFLEMLAGLGLQARSLPVDKMGRLDLEETRILLRQMAHNGEVKHLKALYLVSYFSNPSGRSLDTEEKAGLAGVLKECGLGVRVIEDAAYRDLYFHAPPSAPGLIGLDVWHEFPCLYLATLTKSFATGLKIGYGYCTDADWLARMLSIKGHHDFGTANFNQAICEEVLGSTDFDQHLATLRPMYQRKMHVLHQALERGGLREQGWRWQMPRGGLYLWLEAPSHFNTGLDSAFCHACIEAGVLYVPGDLCFGDKPLKNYVRLSFAALDEDRLDEAGRRFASAIGQFRGRENTIPPWTYGGKSPTSARVS